MKRVVIFMFYLVFLLLTACAPDLPTPPGTQKPSSTRTPLPFSTPDLTFVLNYNRSLFPPMATSAEISDIPHPSFAALPIPQHFTSIRYLAGSEFGGRISIFIYTYPEDMDAAWSGALNTIVSPKEISGIGELAAVNYSDLAFIRCDTLIHIKLAHASPEEIRIFAQFLDSKLSSSLCR